MREAWPRSMGKKVGQTVEVKPGEVRKSHVVDEIISLGERMPQEP